MYFDLLSVLLYDFTVNGIPWIRFPLPSNRHHRSNGYCLEGKRGNCQVCSVQLCTVQCTHMNRP